MGGFENEAHNIGGLTEENYGCVRAVVKCEEQTQVKHFPKKFSEVGTTQGEKEIGRPSRSKCQIHACTRI